MPRIELPNNCTRENLGPAGSDPSHGQQQIKTGTKGHAFHLVTLDFRNDRRKCVPSWAQDMEINCKETKRHGRQKGKPWKPEGNQGKHKGNPWKPVETKENPRKTQGKPKEPRGKTIQLISCQAAQSPGPRVGCPVTSTFAATQHLECLI